MNELGLSEAIGQLRREIGASMQAALNEPLQFQLDAVELELQVQLSAKAGAKGEVKWVVVSFGADAGAERTRTHKVKLTLTPSYEGAERQPQVTTATVRRIVARSAKIAGLGFPVHPHMLRHATGYYLANQGTDPRTIQAYLGHRNIMHTVRYTQLAADRFRTIWRDD